MKTMHTTKLTLSIIASVMLLGMTTNALSATAAKDYALSFFQEGQGILVADSDSLDIDDSLTIEAWVYADSAIYDAYYNFIVSKHMNGTGYALGAFGGDENNKHIQFENSFVLPANQWTHIAYVCGEGLDKLYINGVFVAESIHEEAIIANEFDLYIGHSPFGQQLNWKGLLDEVRIWNVARTQQEIYTDMYTKPSGNKAELVAYWDFNDGPKSTVLKDKTNNKNNGVLINDGNISSKLPKWVLSDRPSLLNKPIK